MMKRLLIVAMTLGGAAAACDSSTLNPPPPPPAETVTFQLRNDGFSTVYLFESCLVDLTITSLASPVHQIRRAVSCGCTCGQVECGVCGACFEGPLEVGVGAMLSESWWAVDWTTQTTSRGSCEQSTTLPPGAYRIDVPVYSTG